MESRASGRLSSDSRKAKIRQLHRQDEAEALIPIVWGDAERVSWGIPYLVEM
jgi:hypothetical protein